MLRTLFSLFLMWVWVGPGVYMSLRDATTGTGTTGTALALGLIFVLVGVLAIWMLLSDDLKALPKRAFWICLGTYLAGVGVMQTYVSVPLPDGSYRSLPTEAYSFRALFLDPIGIAAIILGIVLVYRRINVTPSP